MGYYGRLELKKKAQKMRTQGKSYLEIVHKLHIPKSTISDWCKNIQLTNKQLNVLYKNKITGALKGSIIAAENKKKLRKKQVKTLYIKGSKDIGKLTKRDRFIAGIAFYASEGTKSDKGCAFANSDPTIIKFMVNWFKEFGNVPDIKFHGALWIHHNLNELRAKKFWSLITGIPVKQFYKSYRVGLKEHSKKIRKNIYENGVFTLYISDVTLIRIIMGWIGGLTNKSCYNA